jgi:Protein ChrB, N-terminal
MAAPLRPECWIVLTYRVPREPSANRVYVWRKLKQLGAIALQDAAWVLPETPKTHEHFQWLAAEIAELGGEARLWSSTLSLELSDNSLRQQFVAQVEEEYKLILTDLKRKGRDLPAIARRFQQAAARDYFSSELRQTVRQRLLDARENKPT